MVGSGTLIKLLFGLDYTLAVIIVGVVMMTYVLFGGMIATTWVQLIKACLLLGGAAIMAIIVLWKFGFNPMNLFSAAVDKYGQAQLEPGTKIVTGAWDAVSLGLALMFGTAGLPHILMRFYTVPDAKQARVSVMWATIWIGAFYLITFILGFGAMVLVGKQQILAVGGGGNMAAPLLAQAIAGNIFFGFICAVAFATILAVVAGLTLAGAGALSHDLWVNVIRRGHAPEHEQFIVARISSIILGVCAVLLGIVFQGQNVAYMVGLTFSIAASANFPALMMSVFWRRFTTWGAVSSILFGTFGTLLLIYLGPTIQIDLLGPKAAAAGASPEAVAAAKAAMDSHLAYVTSQWWYFPLKNPCLFTMTGSFLIGIIVSLLAPERAAEDGFAEVERRALLGEPTVTAAE
jgi:cation/acetate symporter